MSLPRGPTLPRAIFRTLCAGQARSCSSRSVRHHLFLNHGTWFVRYSLRPSPFLKADVRRAASLRTKDLAVARERRDAFLAQLRAEQLRSQSAGVFVEAA